MWLSSNFFVSKSAKNNSYIQKEEPPMSKCVFCIDCFIIAIAFSIALAIPAFSADNSMGQRNAELLQDDVFWMTNQLHRRSDDVISIGEIIENLSREETKSESQWRQLKKVAVVSAYALSAGLALLIVALSLFRAHKEPEWLFLLGSLALLVELLFPPFTAPQRANFLGFHALWKPPAFYYRVVDVSLLLCEFVATAGIILGVYVYLKSRLAQRKRGSNTA